MHILTFILIFHTKDCNVGHLRSCINQIVVYTHSIDEKYHESGQLNRNGAERCKFHHFINTHVEVCYIRVSPILYLDIPFRGNTT